MSSDSEIAVRVRGLGKAYTIAHRAERHVTLAESLLARARRPFARVPKETFWALRDVEFDINKGDVVGIIGRNGAGKSTLLKILSRITEPTVGQIDLYGRVGSLLEVGTGFHPELTGRENVFLNGAILGMTKAEIRKQFDAIVDFAGVEKFLDTPVKRYSSGMYVRLAFAVAAHLNSEILIVDEVLAVGDAEFQRKCIGKMREVSGSKGKTVLFVSHNLSAIRALCSRAVLLTRGKIVANGAVDQCVAEYTKVDGDAGNIVDRGVRGSSRISLTIHNITVDGLADCKIYVTGESPRLLICVSGDSPETIRIDIEALLYDANDTLLGQFSPGRSSGRLHTVESGPFALRAHVELPDLNEGTYFLSLIISEPNIQSYWDYLRAIELVSSGVTLANGTTLTSSSSGPLFLSGSVKLEPIQEDAGGRELHRVDRN